MQKQRHSEASAGWPLNGPCSDQGPLDHPRHGPANLRFVEWLQRWLGKKLIPEAAQMLALVVGIVGILPLHTAPSAYVTDRSGQYFRNFTGVAYLSLRIARRFLRMASHVKTIAGAKEVVLKDGSA